MVQAVAGRTGDFPPRSCFAADFERFSNQSGRSAFSNWARSVRSRDRHHAHRPTPRCAAHISTRSGCRPAMAECIRD